MSFTGSWRHAARLKRSSQLGFFEPNQMRNQCFQDADGLGWLAFRLVIRCDRTSDLRFFILANLDIG
jgi:hypothetical protein